MLVGLERWGRTVVPRVVPGMGTRPLMGSRTATHRRVHVYTEPQGRAMELALALRGQAFPAVCVM